MYRVLIIDDDQEILNFCKVALKNPEVGVIAEASPYRVRELIKVHKFNLVVLDIFIPAISGLKLLTEIKDGAVFTYPIVMLTAKRSPKDVQDSIKNGASDYLVKPLKIKALQERVGAHLAKTEPVINFNLDKTESVELTLADEKTVVTSELTHVCEYGLTIKTNADIKLGELITVKTPFFEQLINAKSAIIKMYCNQVKKSSDGHTEVFLSTIGVTNSSILDQIRVWVKGASIKKKVA